MDLKKQISQDLTIALKEKDEIRISTLKLALSSLHNKEIELKKKEQGLTKEEMVDVLKNEAKKRRDAINAYKKGGRPKAAERENQELKIIEKYLPPEMADTEIEKIIKDTIKELNVDSTQNFGQIMGITMKKLKGQADGNKVSQMVKRLLDK